MTIDRPVYIVIYQWWKAYWPIIGHLYGMTLFFIRQYKVLADNHDWKVMGSNLDLNYVITKDLRKKLCLIMFWNIMGEYLGLKKRSSMVIN